MHGNKIERIIDTIEDEYIKDIILKNGYGKLKFKMQRDIDALVKEGFVLNDFALKIIKEFYGVRMNTAGDIDHFCVQMSIDPITASGEFDESFKETEELLGSTIFPLGEFFQNDLYVSSDGKIYSLGGARITLRGDSFTDFLNKVFKKELLGSSVVIYDGRVENI